MQSPKDVLDAFLHLDNLRGAYRRVLENAGAPGVDGQTVDDFGWELRANLEALRDDLLTGSYAPSPLRGVSIAKAGGGERHLAIPTVRDRVAQTALAIVLVTILEPTFEDVSFGYRPGRSVEQALARVARWRDLGYTWVVDADIASYFDEIPHGPLLALLARHVAERKVIDLVAGWIRAPVRQHRQMRQRERGVPQGSPLSPLLANLYLDGFDEAQARKGHRIVRYADDFVVLCRSQPDAERALELTDALLRELDLSLQEQKTRITSFAEGFRFLGKDFLGSFVLRASSDAVPGASSRQPEPAAARRPLMRSLYVQTQGAMVGRSGQRLVVRQGDSVLQELPSMHVDQVVLLGNVQISTPAVRLCADHQIPVFFLSRLGRFVAEVTHDATRTGLLRAQVTKTADPAAQLAFARAAICGRIRNARTVLRRTVRRQTDVDVQQALAFLGEMAERVQQATGLDAVRGFEGAAAARYFGIWPSLFSTEFAFDGHRRRPATDPVNALLNYGSTLLYLNTVSLLRAVGLHPSLGLLHESEERHACLASDLMEEFRAPIVEATVLRLVRNREVAPADFERPEGQGDICRFTDAARPRIVAAFEKAMQRPFSHPDAAHRGDYRRAILGQAQRLAEWFRGERDDYVAVEIR